MLADRPNVNLCAGASLETQITPWAWTTFFRGSFFIPADRLASGKARLSHVIDDGALFYLNGREIFRFNMPGGTITFDTQPPAPMNASCRGPLILQVTNLVGRGANVLAVEVHDSFLSPDVAMGAKLDLLLTPLLPTRPTLSISAEARSGSTLECRISWRPTNRFWLVGATHLSSNPPWTLLSTNAPPYVFSVDSASEATIPRFFRVRSPD